MKDRRTAVYRLYDAAGDLLYVGISMHPETRFAEHEQDKWWWHQVVQKTLTWYNTRAQAKAAEDAAIVNEKPRHDRTWRMSGSVARKAGITRFVERDPNIAPVAEAMRAAIQDGRYEVGSRLPDYRGIADLHQVSLVTAKCVVSELQRDGMICNLSNSAGYPATVIRRSPGKPVGKEEGQRLVDDHTARAAAASLLPQRQAEPGPSKAG